MKIEYDNHTIIQAENCHVTIQRNTDGRRIFHSQTDKKLSEAELISFYKAVQVLCEG